MRKAVWICLTFLLIMTSCPAIAGGDWKCSGCGRTNAGNFCPDCGTEGPKWVCPFCGDENFSNYCEDCGHAKPVYYTQRIIWDYTMFREDYSWIAETDGSDKLAGESGSVMERLFTFFTYWSGNRHDDMLELCAPGWADERPGREAMTVLFGLLENRTPEDLLPVSISEGEAEDVCVVTVKSHMYRNNYKPAVLYQYELTMMKEFNEWYIDPPSLKTSIIAEEDE